MRTLLLCLSIIGTAAIATPTTAPVAPGKATVTIIVDSENDGFVLSDEVRSPLLNLLQDVADISVVALASNSRGLWPSIAQSVKERIRSRPTQEKKFAIILSNGFWQSDPGAVPKRDDFVPLVNSLLEANVAVFVLNRRSGPNSLLLEQLATLTQGWYLEFERPDEAQAKLLRVVELIGQFNGLPVDNELVRIDNGTQRATFVLFRPDPNLPAEFTTPTFATFSQFNAPKNVRWTSTANFEIVSIDKPSPGTWQVHSPWSAQDRVLIDNPLRLSTDHGAVVSMAQSFQTIRYFLSDKGAVVVNPEEEPLTLKVSHSVDNGSEETTFPLDSGRDPDATAGDGVFTEHLAHSDRPGLHHIRVIAATTRFQRELNTYFQVYDTPVLVQQIPQHDATSALVTPRLSLTNADTLVFSYDSHAVFDEPSPIHLWQADAFLWRLDVPRSLPELEVNAAVMGNNGENYSTWFTVMNSHETAARRNEATPHRDSESHPIQTDPIPLPAAKKAIDAARKKTDPNWTVALLQVLAINGLAAVLAVMGRRRYARWRAQWYADVLGALQHE